MHNSVTGAVRSLDAELEASWVQGVRAFANGTLVGKAGVPQPGGEPGIEQVDFRLDDRGVVVRWSPWEALSHPGGLDPADVTSAGRVLGMTGSSDSRAHAGIGVPGGTAQDLEAACGQSGIGYALAANDADQAVGAAPVPPERPELGRYRRCGAQGARSSSRPRTAGPRLRRSSAQPAWWQAP